MGRTPKAKDEDDSAKPTPQVFMHEYTERPHVNLALADEAREVAEDLRDSGVVESHIHIYHAGNYEGMPAAEGEFRPYLICWEDVHPVTNAPVGFRCSAGALWKLYAEMPRGSWAKDYEARTLTRVTT